MATHEEIRTISRKLAELVKTLDICEQVGKALVETGQRWRSESHRTPTDFERVRDKVRKNLVDARAGLLRIRASEFSPDAIRATACVLKLGEACERCPELNLKNLKANKQFTCMAREQLGNTAQGVRFKLDAKGGIVESR